MEIIIASSLFLATVVAMALKINSLKRGLSAEKSLQKEVSIGGVKAPKEGLKVMSPEEAERLLEYLEPQVRNLREIIARKKTPTPGVYKKAIFFSLSIEVDGQSQVFQT